MELDNLKNLWQLQAPPASTPTLPDESELRKLVAGRSRTALNQMKRSLGWEIGLGVVTTAIGLGLSKGGWPVYGLLAVWLLAGPYYWFKFRLLNDSIPAKNLRENLRLRIHRLDKLLRFYWWFNMALFPPATLAGLVYGALAAKAEIGKPTHLAALFTNGRFLVLATLTLAVSVGVGLVVFRYYIRYFYGRYLEQLKGGLRELEEE